MIGHGEIWGALSATSFTQCKADTLKCIQGTKQCWGNTSTGTAPVLVDRAAAITCLDGYYLAPLKNGVVDTYNNYANGAWGVAHTTDTEWIGSQCLGMTLYLYINTTYFSRLQSTMRDLCGLQSYWKRW